ncbi:MULTISPECIES: PIN domain-containing protein [Synechocystis]|uniref:PIN domain-containing protein n=1 Tax=Synechocystis salina LEGE 00031 TaxID=1828736 RepID=A0ABR9VXH0_9SYNC|nr:MULTISPECIES: PIN domain-containing protein [Synechocystis]MBD2655499.1 PIN domain-containing protein [Synechocystis sp. FACHB-383]MBE9242831.1 PIN domain-containing protein [Synechocystis salina LEGE 00041]MBE9255098.1 PIN domain-containing protein [Synechocystis salina LEGE 00031]
MPSNYTALYDACVLYPAPLRDLLLQLALTDLFRAKWTDDIHQEWLRNVLNKRPDLTLEQLTRTRDLMNSHVRDCLITGYESLIPALHLPDPDDRHVLAAAIQGGVDVIVTFNLKDFPPRALAPYDIEAQHPDEFIACVIDLKPITIAQAVETVRRRLRSPPMTKEEHLETLLCLGLPLTISRLREICYEI